MAPRHLCLAVLLSTALLAAPPPAAQAKQVVVYVCGKNLCRVAPDGSERRRLTRDGARSGPYSRPALALRGRRLAFRKGRRGRVHTAQLGPSGLRSVRRIGPAPDGAPDATQFDVAISRDGRRVASVELRINVVFSTIDYRRYAADFDGGGIAQVAANGGGPFVAFSTRGGSCARAWPTASRRARTQPRSTRGCAFPTRSPRRTARAATAGRRPPTTLGAATCAIRTSRLPVGGWSPPRTAPRSRSTTRSSGRVSCCCSTRPARSRSASSLQARPTSIRASRPTAAASSSSAPAPCG